MGAKRPRLQNFYDKSTSLGCLPFLTVPQRSPNYEGQGLRLDRLHEFWYWENFSIFEILSVLFDPVSCVVTRDFLFTQCADQETAVSFGFWAGGIVLAEVDKSKASSGIGEGRVSNMSSCEWILSSGELILFGSPIVVKHS